MNNALPFLQTKNLQLKTVVMAELTCLSSMSVETAKILKRIRQELGQINIFILAFSMLIKSFQLRYMRSVKSNGVLKEIL